MRWLKVPIDDELYSVLELLADVQGSSPEEIVHKVITATLRTYTKYIIEGREEELRQFLRQKVSIDVAVEASKIDMPEAEPKLWTP